MNQGPSPNQLFKAAAENNVAALSECLKSGIDPNLLYKGNSALHYAAGKNHPIIAFDLLRAGARVDAPNKEKQTPLHVAVSTGKIEVAWVLLQEGKADLFAKDAKGRIPILLTQDQNMISLLALFGSPRPTGTIVKPFTTTFILPEDLLDIHVAARAGNSKNLHNLCFHYGDIFGEDIDQFTKYLISQDKFGLTPLHHAVLKDDIECAEIIIDEEINVDVQDIFGRTPLHIAAQRNLPQIIRRLMIEGADCHKRDRSEKSPLEYAQEHPEYSRCHQIILDTLEERKKSKAEVDEEDGLTERLSQLVIPKEERDVVKEFSALVIHSETNNAQNNEDVVSAALQAITPLYEATSQSLSQSTSPEPVNQASPKTSPRPGIQQEQEQGQSNESDNDSEKDQDQLQTAKFPTEHPQAPKNSANLPPPVKTETLKFPTKAKSTQKQPGRKNKKKSNK